MKLLVLAALSAAAAPACARAEQPDVSVVFPPEGGRVAASGRTYVIGSVHPPDTPLTVNGQAVTPWRTGGFLLMAPVTAGTNTLTLRAGSRTVTHRFTVPPAPAAWDGSSLSALAPLRPLGVFTGESVRIACLAPAGRAVSALVGERLLPLTPDPFAPTRYSAQLAFPSPAEQVPVVFFSEGLADRHGAALTARAEWPTARVTGPLFETRARSEPGDGDTVAFLTPGLRLQGAGFAGDHTRLWLGGRLCFTDTRFVTCEAAGAPPPPRDLKPPDLGRAAPLRKPGSRQPAEHLIVIDPGHGGASSGAMGPTGVPEKQATLEQARAVARALESAGFRVRLTRSGDTDLGLYERCQIAYAEQASAFISLHYNATVPSTNPAEVRHIQSFFWDGPGERLARALHPRLAAVTPVPDRGVSWASFAVCRNPAVPSCLLELDFINCPEGEEAIRQPERQRRVAEAITAGLLDWLAP
jgi:N-acetylmuramoyl-L-alanine amidase